MLLTRQITRRQFLSGSGQIGAGWLALQSATAAAAGRVSKMRFGLMTYQWGIDWDVPTLIANCATAKAYAVELRTSAHYAHGVELTHFHELDRGDFPYQLQSDLLIDAGWDGWWLLEARSKPPDRVQAMILQRAMWEAIVAKSLNRS